MSDPSCQDGRGTLPAEGLGALAFLLNHIEPIEGPVMEAQRGAQVPLAVQKAT